MICSLSSIFSVDLIHRPTLKYFSSDLPCSSIPLLSEYIVYALLLYYFCMLFITLVSLSKIPEPFFFSLSLFPLHAFSIFLNVSLFLLPPALGAPQLSLSLQPFSLLHYPVLSFFLPSFVSPNSTCFPPVVPSLLLLGVFEPFRASRV